MRRFNRAVLVSGALILMSAIGLSSAEDAVKKQIPVEDSTFQCMSEMTAVRHFYVDNLLGNLEGTVAVANSTTGGVYPPGSVL